MDFRSDKSRSVAAEDISPRSLSQPLSKAPGFLRLPPSRPRESTRSRTDPFQEFSALVDPGHLPSDPPSFVDFGRTRQGRERERVRVAKRGKGQASQSPARARKGLQAGVRLGEESSALPPPPPSRAGPRRHVSPREVSKHTRGREAPRGHDRVLPREAFRSPSEAFTEEATSPPRPLTSFCQSARGLAARLSAVPVPAMSFVRANDTTRSRPRIGSRNNPRRNFHVAEEKIETQ